MRGAGEPRKQRFRTAIDEPWPAAPLKPNGLLPGTLNAFDGVDGSGRTTTVRLAFLESRGRAVRGFKLSSREP